MSVTTGDPYHHSHVFLGADHARNERRTWIVIGLTAAMMVGEIVAGMLFGSMALLADGFHMATHAGALSIAALAYRFARRRAGDAGFTFGTGKMGELAGYSSAVILGVVALLIGVESLMRLRAPVTIQFDSAIAVAALGLVVNLASAWLLRDEEHHHGHHGHGNGNGHGHGHGHDEHEHGDGHGHRDAHGQGHRDHNLRAAYFHVLADALTSVLAITGLVAGRFYGWLWMDPAVGILGALVIARWSWSLLRDSGAVLLDRLADPALAGRVRRRLERDGDRVADLHLWHVGPGHMALIVAVVAERPRAPEHYKRALAELAAFSHVTIEVQPRQPAPRQATSG